MYEIVKKPPTDKCNVSMESGYFLDRLKLAIVKHLLKERGFTNISKIIDSSLVSVFSKILENIMCSRLIAFITKSSVLTEAQNGFR